MGNETISEHGTTSRSGKDFCIAVIPLGPWPQGDAGKIIPSRQMDGLPKSKVRKILDTTPHARQERTAAGSFNIYSPPTARRKTATAVKEKIFLNRRQS